MNLLQQFIIRRVGASLFAMGTALRLVASIAGRQAILDSNNNATTNISCIPFMNPLLACMDRAICTIWWCLIISVTLNSGGILWVLKCPVGGQDHGC